MMQFLGDSRALVGRRISTKMLWSCNVLGSHAWPLSRTNQIVAHCCNSSGTIASLVNRRISKITARNCSSRQMSHSKKTLREHPFLLCMIAGSVEAKQYQSATCKMLWFCDRLQPGFWYNVLGPHAWPICRTYQIVSH